MKNLFPGHFKPTKEDFKKLWTDSIFAFDANILLNLYRYSETTRNEFLKIIAVLNDQVWVPYQATEEYFRNRISTTGGQAKEYDKVVGVVDELLLNLGNKKRHPFIKEDLYKELESIIQKIKTEFDSNKKQLNDRIYDDEILNKVSEIFEQKVGVSLDKESLENIYKDGELRYEAEIPPGFRDGNKDKSGNSYRKFGDLIIWHELMNEAKSKNKSFIFITDDKKDDWWHEYNGRTIGPLPFLIKEFKDKTGQDFYMYTADRFMQAAKEYSSEKIEDEVISELREFRQQEEEEEKINQTRKFLRTTDIESYREPLYRVATSDEITTLLFEYAQLRQGDTNGFIGLKNFVTTFLADKDIEINHAYSSINELSEKGIIELYDKPVGDYLVKAIKLNIK